ncbi:MAG: hypothetical protein K6E70_07640 [Butyrivibrio sp.]|nr:hypothetical protein [Butyrivibrio sp.]
MRKEIKKVCKRIALAAAVFCAVITFGKSDVKAEEHQCGNLTIGQEKTVTLSSSSWQDNFYFHFTTPKSGSFRMSIVLTERRRKEDNSPVDSGHASVKATIDYKDIWETGIWVGDGTAISPEYAYPAGKDCTFRINSLYEDYKYTFKIKIENVKYSNFEKEGNNFANAATKLKKNKTTDGILNKGDTDWYVFKAPKTGKYKFSIVDADTKDGGWVHCAAYKSKTKEDYGKSHTVWQGNGWYKINTLKLKKGKKYYLKITSSSREGIHYQIKVKKVK